MSNHPLELCVSQTFLAHAILAHISPEVTTLDRILALQSQGALRTATEPNVKSLANIPPELLLAIRAYLIPTITDALIAETMLTYADSLLSRARRLCGECLKYNVQVYGPDALTWPSARPGLSDEAQGCECGAWALRKDLCIASEWAKMDVSVFKEPTEPKVGAKRGHKRTHSYSATSVSWLEEYLAKRAGRGQSMNDVVADILAKEFGCTMAGDAASSKRPSSSNAEVPDTVSIVVPSRQSAPPSAQDKLRILVRELALITTPNVGSEILTTARDMSASIISSTVAQPSKEEIAAQSWDSRDARPAPAGPSLFTLVSAGLALGAYALARLTLTL